MLFSGSYTVRRQARLNNLARGYKRTSSRSTVSCYELSHRLTLDQHNFPHIAVRSTAGTTSAAEVEVSMAPPTPRTSGRLIDMRSDTVTRPTDAMRKAAMEVHTTWWNFAMLLQARTRQFVPDQLAIPEG